MSKRMFAIYQKCLIPKSNTLYADVCHFKCVVSSSGNTLSKFGEISFQEYVSKGTSHPVFHGDLVYKLRRNQFRLVVQENT